MKIIQAGFLVLCGAVLSMLFQAQVAYSSADNLAKYEDELIRLAKLINVDSGNNVTLKTDGALNVSATKIHIKSLTDAEITATTTAKFSGLHTRIGRSDYKPAVTADSIILCAKPLQPCVINPASYAVMLGK